MGDGGQVRASKKLPDALRYSPPRPPNSRPSDDDYPRHDDSPKTQPQKTNGHLPNGGLSQANGHAVLPKEARPALPPPPPPASKPVNVPESLPKNSNDGANRPGNGPALVHKNSQNDHSRGLKGQFPANGNSKAPERRASIRELPRAYDDYELTRRRQLMDSQGWPRDPKDYLIGGIYGPQPKSKPNESQPPQQPPSKDQGRGKTDREPYRSRSFPRDNKAPVNDDPLRDRRPNNNNGNHHNPTTNNGNNNTKRQGGPSDRAFSLIDPAEGDVGKGRRGREPFGHERGPNHRFDVLDDDGMAVDFERDVRVLYPRGADGSPVHNGPRHATNRKEPAVKRPGRRSDVKPPWNANFGRPAFDEAVVTSDIINNDGLNSYKARLITFFKNGDPFFPGIKISIRPGRDFASLEALYNYLTPRTDLPAGVRYIFSLDGRKVRELDELEDGGQYVCSSRKKFVHLNYGMGKRDWKPHSKLAGQADLKLFRPPSPGTTVVGGGGGVVGGRERKSPDGQPGSREGRVIRVINNDDHTVQSRILLNLRTAQPWEEVLQDLGQALRMPAAKRLFTYSGQEVQSFSQLRNDFREVDTFYLCTEHDIREPVRGRGRSRGNTKSNSPPGAYVDPIRVKIRGQRREVYPPMNQRYQRDESPPDKNLELNWVYGYRGHDARLNLSLLPTGELLYYVAAVAVLYDRIRNRQRHYTGHTEDIQCMTLHPSRELCATGQKEGKGRYSRAQVHVWDIDTLSTQMVIGINDVENGIIALSFSFKFVTATLELYHSIQDPKIHESYVFHRDRRWELNNLGQHLLIVDDSPEHMISIWNWKSKRLLSKAPVHRSKLIGGQFIPRDDNQTVTFGESHLTIWRRQKDGGFDRDDLLDDEAKTITCVEFDDEGDQYLITGDTDGNITLWADARSGIYQSVRVVQAHMRAVSAMLMLPDGTLLSSGGNEKDRYIKAWDSNHNYRAITFARLPESAGGVRSLCPSKLDSPDLGIFAGTSKNMILEGSIHRRFKIVVQGHFRQLTALAVDPDEPAFVTAGYDKSISRWAMHKLVWKVQVQSECTCLAIHPMGEVVAVGTTDGHFIVLTLHRGMHVATLPASKQVITCLAYSPDGSVLAVALEEGSLTLYSVSGRGYAYRRIRILRGYDPVIQMDWSRDGKSIQSVTADYNSVLWDMINMEMEKIPSTLRDVKWHTMTCTLSYSVNGIWNNVNQMVESMNTTCCGSASEKLLVTGDDEGYIRLFRYPAITPRSDFHEIKAQTSRINVVRFLYDDSFVIAIGGEDAVLMQWMIVHAK